MEKTKELIVRAKNHDQVAFEELSELYFPLIHSLANKYYATCKEEVSLDDFIQEAQIAFNDAIARFNVENERVTFGAYSKVCIRNRLISCVRKLKSKKRMKGLVHKQNVDSSIQDTVVYRELLTLAGSTLSPYEKKILQLKADGHSAKEISVIVGKSEKSVSNAIYRSRSKIRDTIK